MPKTQTAPAALTTVPCTHLTTSTITYKINLKRYGYCPNCNDTGTVTQCTACHTIGCDGHCGCTYCGDEQTITCEHDGCDGGYLIDEQGDPTTTKCPTCTGTGQITCPRC